MAFPLPNSEACSKSSPLGALGWVELLSSSLDIYGIECVLFR